MKRERRRSEAISIPALAYAVTPDPGGWNATWDGQHRQVTLIHLPWTPATRYTVTLSQARDLAGNDLVAGPVRWSYQTVQQLYLPLTLRTWAQP